MTRIGGLAAAGVIAMIGLVSPAGPFTAPPAAAGTVTATTVEQTSPVGPSGHLLPGYRVVHNYSGATCRSHSPEVGNAYSCHVRYGFDPCWLTAKRAYVVCLTQPYGRKVNRLHVARFVNKGGLGQPKPMPWGLQLANGAKTTLILGDFGTASGKQIHYTLDSRYKTVLAGPIDKSGPVWRIRKARNNGRFQFKVTGWVNIKKAWFAAPTQLS